MPSPSACLFIMQRLNLFMSMLDFILRRPSVYNIRKEYDRLREKADKLHKIEQRLEVLRMLDQGEPSIISLEEHHMPGYEKKKVYGFVSPQLRKVKFMIDESKRAAKHKETEFKDEKRTI